ncbi:hypothetical protein VNO80_08016 [Phaseolus coccineus]|uniref:Uncharacterized protein n=1 Tax=Phaseolus coccineus TaxID=3886 RepID=A0AAN9RK55_PHACN
MCGLGDKGVKQFEFVNKCFKELHAKAGPSASKEHLLTCCKLNKAHALCHVDNADSVNEGVSTKLSDSLLAHVFVTGKVGPLVDDVGRVDSRSVGAPEGNLGRDASLVGEGPGAAAVVRQENETSREGRVPSVGVGGAKRLSLLEFVLVDGEAISASKRVVVGIILSRDSDDGSKCNAGLGRGTKALRLERVNGAEDCDGDGAEDYDGYGVVGCSGVRVEVGEKYDGDRAKCGGKRLVVRAETCVTPKVRNLLCVLEASKGSRPLRLASRKASGLGGGGIGGRVQAEVVKDKVREFFSARFVRDDSFQIKMDNVKFNGISGEDNEL